MRRKECDRLTLYSRRHGRRPWRAVPVVIALLWGGSAHGGGQVEILPTASVADGQIRVADVAFLAGFPDAEARAKLGSLILGEAPPPGERLGLHIRQIREALYEQGVNLGEIALKGSAQVTVARRVDAGVGEGSAAEQPALAGSLEAFLRERIQAQLGASGGRVEILFSRTPALSLHGPEYSFQLTGEEPLRPGMLSLAVDVLRGGEPVQTVHALADVTLVRTVAVASRPINRGRVIERADVELVERCFKRLTQLGETDPARVVGQQARRFIDRGEMIDERDVKSVPLVRRNDLVTVWNRSGPVSVRTVGKSLGSGSLGEVVEVRSERSGERYAARITGVRTVEVGATREEI